MYKKIIYLIYISLSYFNALISFANSPHGIGCTEMSYLLDNKKAVLIDVRDIEEYAHRRPKEAIFLSIRQIVTGNFDSLIGDINPSRPIIFYCDNGYYSSIAKNHFEKIFPNRDIVFLKGGMNNCPAILPLIGDHKKTPLLEWILSSCGGIILLTSILVWKVSNRFLTITITLGIFLIIGSLFQWHDVIGYLKTILNIT